MRHFVICLLLAASCWGDQIIAMSGSYNRGNWSGVATFLTADGFSHQVHDAGMGINIAPFIMVGEIYQIYFGVRAPSTHGEIGTLLITSDPFIIPNIAPDSSVDITMAIVWQAIWRENWDTSFVEGSGVGQLTLILLGQSRTLNRVEIVPGNATWQGTAVPEPSTLLLLITGLPLCLKLRYFPRPF